MAPVLDATLGGPTSNSYIDLADAEILAANIVGGEAWIALPQEEKDFSLIQATFWLETLDYQGQRCANDQRLKWPRQNATCDGVVADCTYIPYKILEAEVMLAIKYTESPSSFPGAGGGSNAPSGTYVKRQRLDALEIEYAQFNSNVGSSCDDCDAPPIINAFRWLEAVLGCWLFLIDSDSGRVLTRECTVQPSLSPRTPVRSSYMPKPPY